MTDEKTRTERAYIDKSRADELAAENEKLREANETLRGLNERQARQIEGLRAELRPR
jgi:hypothetical protein